MRFFHRKVSRLFYEKEIGNLFTEGKSHFAYPIKTVFLKFESNQPNYRVLMSVSKRNVKRAVKRNLIKRRMKEAFRLNSMPLKKALEGKNFSINVAFIYVSSGILSYKEIEQLIVKQIAFLSNTINRFEK